MKSLFLIVALLVLTLNLSAQIRAFPGAEGGGMYVTGGRGGKVLIVENLNDSGPGSLRSAIEAKGPRIIVFEVSGLIELHKPLLVKNNDITIAGQTAPGSGICIKNYGLRIDADNVIIRFIRIRPGDITGEENDAISGIRNRDIIIDHCSFSWSNDEVASFYDNLNFTLQWCIVSESLYKSVHHKGEHGYGGIWGGQNASFHHNLLSDHTSRNPRFCGSRYSADPQKEMVDYRNNVIYNWGFNSAYGGEEGNYNLVKNYYKPGPATKKSVKSRILNLTQLFYDPNINPDTLGAGFFYIDGNVMEGNPEVTVDNWGAGIQGKGVDQKAKEYSKLVAPLPCAQVTTTDALTAFEDVLNLAGASIRYDEVDLRILQEAKTGHEKFGATFAGGGKGIIDSQADVGGWPSYLSQVSHVDSDKDGMPDQWEMQNHLNPELNDSNGNSLDPDYTHIEVYLNSLVEHIMQGKDEGNE